MTDRSWVEVAADNYAELARRSPLLIAQEYLPTEFDWRVTVLDGKVLFAAKYHMARGHWQIRAESTAGKERYGRVEAVPRESAPRAVVPSTSGSWPRLIERTARSSGRCHQLVASKVTAVVRHLART